MNSLTNYQEQILMQPNVTLYGASHDNYATFALKDTWTTFAVANDVFPGVRSGQPLQAGNDDAQWIWPHEIVAFLWNVPGGFLPVLASAPSAVYEFFRAVSDAGVTQETARQFVRNEPGAWREFFAALGNHPRFIELRPEWARWCRYFGGVGPMPTATAKPLRVEDLDDKEVFELVATLALGLGIIVAAIGAAVGLIVTIIGTAVTVAVAFPPAAPFMIIIGIGLIVLTALGWVLSVALAIIYMVVQGLVIFHPGTQRVELTALAS